MGNLVLSSLGKDANYTKDWIQIIILSLAFIVLGIILANFVGYHVFLYGGLVLGFSILGFGVYAIYKWKKTELFLHENVVRGIAYRSLEITENPDFFDLGYDKIDSVDASGRNTLSIKTNDREYIVYVHNHSYIADEIKKRIIRPAAIAKSSLWQIDPAAALRQRMSDMKEAHPGLYDRAKSGGLLD